MKQKSNTIPLYFDPVHIGHNLVEVGVDYLKVEAKEIETRWFQHADSETDVFVWFDKNRQIIKQQVNHMGHLAEWNVIDGLKTGYMMEAELHSESDKGQVEPASEVIHFDTQIQKQTLANIISIVSHMDCVSEDIKESILHNFKRVPNVINTKSYLQNFWDKLLSVFK